MCGMHTYFVSMMYACIMCFCMHVVCLLHMTCIFLVCVYMWYLWATLNPKSMGKAPSCILPSPNGTRQPFCYWAPSALLYDFPAIPSGDFQATDMMVTVPGVSMPASLPSVTACATLLPPAPVWMCCLLPFQPIKTQLENHREQQGLSRGSCSALVNIFF